MDNSESLNIEAENLPLAKQETHLENLTERNWLFIKYFLETGKATIAYKRAGYKSEVRSAPYVLFKQLKERIEEIGNLDVTSRARLQSDLNKVLDLPLQESKKELTISEWLRVRKFAASITPDVQVTKPQISVLVINRQAKDSIGVVDKGDTSKGNNTPTDINVNDVIDIEPIS